MINKKYITELPETTNPVTSGFTVFDDSNVTYKVSINTLTEVINSKDKIVTGYTIISATTISGGTFYGDGSKLSGIQDIKTTSGIYNRNSGVATFYNDGGGFFRVSGFTTNIKYWFSNESKLIDSTDILTISENMILENSLLIINNSGESINIDGNVFYKRGEIFIGGNLILKNSEIINDGLISVAGAIILNGNSTITGTGIII